MRSARSVHFTTPPPATPQVTDLMKHPLLWLEKRRVIKRLATANPSLGPAGNSLIRYLPIMASIDSRSTLIMSSLADHPIIALRPLPKFELAGLEQKLRSREGTPAQLWLLGILRVKLSQDLVQELPVCALVLPEGLTRSQMRKSLLQSILRSVYDQEMHSPSSSMTSERSTEVRSLGIHRAGRPLRNPRTR
jgi:hypothetical protein